MNTWKSHLLITIVINVHSSYLRNTGMNKEIQRKSHAIALNICTAEQSEYSGISSALHFWRGWERLWSWFAKSMLDWKNHIPDLCDQNGQKEDSWWLLKKFLSHLATDDIRQKASASIVSLLGALLLFNKLDPLYLFSYSC